MAADVDAVALVLDRLRQPADGARRLEDRHVAHARFGELPGSGQARRTRTDDDHARLHRADIIRDVFGGANPVHSSLERFKQEGRGVIVFLRDGAAGVPTHAIPQSGSTGSEVARSRQWREVGLGAQILKDLGITSIRLLTSAKLTYVGLGGFGIEISSTELIDDRGARD